MRSWVFWGDNVVRLFLHLGKVALILEVWKFGRRPYRG